MSDNPNKVGTVMVVTSFKKGDVICAKKNWDNNYILFYRAQEHDVISHSGKGYEFVMVVKES